MSGETLVKCLQRVLLNSPERRSGKSCGLGGRELLARSKRADYCGGRTSYRQHGPEQEVNAHRRISRLHLRNARLTRANQLGHATLRQFPADPKCVQAASEGELHFDERSLLLVEAQKLSGRANLPTRTFKTSLLRAVHRPIPLSTNPSCRSASVFSCTYR